MPRPLAGLPLLLLLALAPGCASLTPSEPAAEARRGPAVLAYRVEYRVEEEAVLAVDVALPAGAGGRWVLGEGWEGVTGLEARVGEEWLALQVAAEGRIDVPSGARALRYRYAIDAVIASRGDWLRTGAGVPGAHLVAGMAYLARPERVPASWQVQLSFAGPLPLVPWARPRDGTFRLRPEDLERPGFHTFGGRRYRFDLAGTRFDLAVLPGSLALDDGQLVDWLSQAARELLTIRAALPFPRVAVTLVPVPGYSGASPFGLFLASSPPSLAIYVGGAARAGALAKDWVAVHELLHMMHPRFQPRVTWLSEGLATYYSVLVRMRSGRLSEPEGWSELVWGTRTGRQEAAGTALNELARTMHQRHSYRAVYWGGALAALELDLAIRQRTAGRRSLDDVLTLLARDGRSANLAAFAAAVDQVAGRPLCEALLRGHLEGPALERAVGLLQRLGVQGPPEEITLDDAAPLAALRRQLTARR